MGSEEQIGSQYDKVSNAHYAVEGVNQLIQMNIIKEQSKRIEQVDVSKKDKEAWATSCSMSAHSCKE